MTFSNKFKICWWVSLLIVITGVSIWRLSVNSLTSTDIFIYTFWFILVLFPIASEISLFGVNVKKDIENAKNEIKSFISQVHNSQTNNITINSSQAGKREYEKKIEQENKEFDDSAEGASEGGNSEEHGYKVIEGADDGKAQRLEKQKLRLQKILMVEGLVNAFFRAKYAEEYSSQIKFEDGITKEEVIVDGIIRRNGQIINVVEIKYIQEKSFERMHYIVSGFIRKWIKFGMRIPILFVIVSDEIDQDKARGIERKLLGLNKNKILNPTSLLVSTIIFKLSDSKLELLCE